MPRRKRTLTESEEWEQKVEDVVAWYKSGKFESLKEAARLTGIDQRTITARLNGRPTRRKAQELNQKLSHVEEEEIARAIRNATKEKKALQPQVGQAMAEAIRKRRIKGVNENGVV